MNYLNRVAYLGGVIELLKKMKSYVRFTNPYKCACVLFHGRIKKLIIAHY